MKSAVRVLADMPKKGPSGNPSPTTGVAPNAAKRPPHGPGGTSGGNSPPVIPTTYGGGPVSEITTT